MEKSSHLVGVPGVTALSFEGLLSIMLRELLLIMLRELPPKQVSRTSSRNIIGRNPSIVIPLLANQDLTHMLLHVFFIRKKFIRK